MDLLCGIRSKNKDWASGATRTFFGGLHHARKPFPTRICTKCLFTSEALPSLRPDSVSVLSLLLFSDRSSRGVPWMATHNSLTRDKSSIVYGKGESDDGAAQQRGRCRHALELGVLSRTRLTRSQRSAFVGDIEMQRRPLLPRSTSWPTHAPSHTTGVEHDAMEASNRLPALSSIPWPGPDFELQQILPGSVYLWACGERGEGDVTSPVSRPEVVAAWVVLCTQLLCYVQLWVVSGDRPLLDSVLSSGSQTAASKGGTDYSITAIAVAMYLLLSIAAADLWGSVALLMEGSGSGSFVLFTRRRCFGGCLLITFGALVGASTRVLFYSSMENVDWVVGAAAVLFIADVDEKAMAVLKNVGGGWRLFWVLQVIGLSFGLAVFVVELTGNGDTVNAGNGCDSAWNTEGCSIYSWWFLLELYPLGVTVLSLLSARACSRPESSITLRVLRPPSRDWWGFSLFIACWGSYMAWDAWMSSDIGAFLGTELGLCALVGVGFAIWRENTDFGRRLKLAYTVGGRRFRPVDNQRRRWLFWSGFVFFVVQAIVESLYAVVVERDDISREFEFDLYDSIVAPARSVFEACDAVLSSATNVWIVLGMELAVMDSPSFPSIHPSRAPLPLFLSVIVGWSVYEGVTALGYWVFWGPSAPIGSSQYVFPVVLFVYNVSWLVWRLAAGTLLWGWTLDFRAIAYWHEASRLTMNFFWCIFIIIRALSDQVVK